MYSVLIAFSEYTYFLISKNIQGLTIGINRVHMYVYFYWHMHDSGHVYVDMYAHFFPMIFESFQSLFGSYNLILFKNLLIYV